MMQITCIPQDLQKMAQQIKKPGEDFLEKQKEMDLLVLKIRTMPFRNESMFLFLRF